jgi:hypothetical protein
VQAKRPLLSFKTRGWLPQYRFLVEIDSFFPSRFNVHSDSQHFLKHSLFTGKHNAPSEAKESKSFDGYHPGNAMKKGLGVVVKDALLSLQSFKVQACCPFSFLITVSLSTTLDANPSACVIVPHS